ncbi:MAG: winged helix-turn-helix transcriptional regulator [Candidatus Altiarchaeales archaeon]|nr:winged helix-turn-helix transcriptional regulator [Candidatus Altiarchaeales archaeon]MBD3416330.1 winged helix-turn-helix transcriptional regulator [Candidatus Altiarchaeales archaeon]
MNESEHLAKIMQLRALGWSQKEIGKELGITESAVSYHLRKLRTRSKEEGVNIFWEIMASSAVRWLNRKMGKLEQMGI